jgi:hypothetical protein
MVKSATSSLVTIIIALGFSMTASASDPEPGTPSVALGSDYFQTVAGTHFNFGGSIGDVAFIGNPTGPFNTDTIIQRQADASIGGAAIPIQIVALSLESTNQVLVGGSFFDVFVTLDPSNLSNDVGSMAISGTTAGGTFSSSLNVFFDAHFQPVSSGTAFDVFSNINLTNAGAPWGPTPTANEVIVNGLDDGTSGDQNANKHSGLLACPPTLTPGCEVDFFLDGQVGGNPTNPLQEGNGTNEAHFAVEATTPEPGTLLLLGSALIALSLKLKLRRA